MNINIERYSFGYDFDMEPDRKGEWVKYEDMLGIIYGKNTFFNGLSRKVFKMEMREYIKECVENDMTTREIMDEFKDRTGEVLSKQMVSYYYIQSGVTRKIKKSNRRKQRKKNYVI